MPAMTTPERDASISQTIDQPILSIRAAVPKEDAERFISDALHEIRVFMQESQISASGPPFSICRPRENELDIEAGWPTVSRPPAGTGRIHGGSVPRSYTGPSR